MKEKHLKVVTLTSPVAYTVVALISFGAGYTTHEYAQTPNKPVSYHQQNATPLTAPNSITTPSVCFTPGKKCQTKLIDEIHKAKKSIYVQAYSFTDKDVTDALVDAAKRGISVNVLLDKSNKNDKRSAKDLLIHSRIPLRFDYPAGIAHNKVMVFDQATVATGSYNFSSAAYKRNTENLLILHSPDLAKEYIQNWQNRWDVSKE
jgi:phosphatidylserine/phosphatidylglycerophosphate/cardiolipin synthase-like enzyme